MGSKPTSWQARDLIGHWSLFGDHATRLAAFKDTGALVNIGSSVAPNKSNHSVGRYFDNTQTDNIKIGSVGWGSMFGVSQNFTFVVKCFSATAGTRKVIVADWNSGGTGASFLIDITASDEFRCIGVDTSDARTAIEAVGSFKAGKVHTVAGVIDYDNNLVELWVDGKFADSAASPFGLETGTQAAFGSGDYVAGSINWQNGFLWDARVYNRVLSAPEHMQIHTNPELLYENKPRFAVADVPTDVRFAPEKKPWTKKPAQYQAKIAKRFESHVIAAWVFDRIRGEMVDISGNGYSATSGTNPGSFSASATAGPSEYTNKHGAGADFDGGHQAFQVMSSVPTGDRLQQVCSYLWAGHLDDAGDGSQRFIDKSDAGDATNGWALAYIPSSDTLEIYRNGSISFYVQIGSILADTPGVLCATTPNPGVTGKGQAWVNGINVRDINTPGADADFGAFADSATACAIGTWNHASAREFNGRMNLLVLFDNELSPALAKSFSLNPWQIFEPQRIHTPINEALPAVAEIERDRTQP